MLSKEQFGEFVMPDLRRMTSYMERSMYHLDGVEQMRFIDQLATLPKLAAIQWNPSKPHDLSEHMSDFKRIRGLGLSLFLTVRSVDDAVYMTKSLGPDGLCMSLPYFDDESDALAAIARIEAAAK